MAGSRAFTGEGEEFWASATSLWLQTLLHVAALRGVSMEAVHSWALARAPGEFLRSMAGAGGEAERWGALIADQMGSSASRTTDTIRYMVAANLGFMVDPVLREAVTPGPGMFSPAEFVREGGTLYLIAESRDERPSPVAGLFAALVIEIYHQAALLAAQMPGGRLDPPMLWALAISSLRRAVFNVLHGLFPVPAWRAGRGYLLPCPLRGSRRRRRCSCRAGVIRRRWRWRRGCPGRSRLGSGGRSSIRGIR